MVLGLIEVGQGEACLLGFQEANLRELSFTLLLQRLELLLSLQRSIFVLERRATSFLCVLEIISDVLIDWVSHLAFKSLG